MAINLTAKGRSLVEELMPIAVHFAEVAVSNYSEDEVDHLKTIFREIYERLGSIEPEIEAAKIVHAHAPALAVVPHVEPPGVVASRARATALLLADLSNSHTFPPSESRHSGWRSSTNPVEDVCGLEPPSSYAESL